MKKISQLIIIGGIIFIFIDISNASIKYHSIVFSSNEMASSMTRLGNGSLYPTGEQLLGNIPFTIPTVENNMWCSDIGSKPNPRYIEINVDKIGVSEVHTIINTFWGQAGPNSYAYIEFIGSGEAYYKVDLVGNIDIRDYNQASWTNHINNSTTIEVFNNNKGQRLDKQVFTLPDAFLVQKLNYIRLVDNGSSSFQRVFLFGITVGIPTCTEDNTGSLDIATTQGRYERNTSASIRIQNAPNKVNSFGFDIVFDSKSLTYTGFTKGTLVQDFEYFDVNLIADGVLRCGGFDSDKPININDTGNVLCLEFNVLQKANSTKIELTDLEDDINTWTFSHGCFQPGCTGDVNKDGKITPQDALCAFDKYMGTCPTSCEIPCNEICGDVNYDNEVTPADALCIFNKYLEKPSCLDPVASSCEK